MLRVFLLFLLCLPVVGMAQNHRLTQAKPKSLQTPKPVAHRVVIHLTSNDSEVHKSVVKQIKHIREAFENKVEIEVVAHNNGISFLMGENNAQSTEIQGLSQLGGVTFSACQNTMNTRNISREQLLNVVGVVSSGLAHIILRQEQGWSYLKAGF